MFAKTVCKPGAFLSVVPVGLRATLQYSAKGLLEKIFIGSYDVSERKNVTDLLLPIMKQSKIVPLGIPTKGGTTWVRGVFYIDKQFFNPGVLPDCVESTIMEDMQVTPTSYTFYAGNVESLATNFGAVMTIRNWLQMSKFNVLPGWIIPAQMDNDAFVKMVNTDKYPFKFPLISGYMIYEGIRFRYHPINLHQNTIQKVSRSLDENGYIKGVLSTDSDSITVQYTDVIRFNINAKTCITCTSSGKILHSAPTDSKKRDARSRNLTCSVCGKQFKAPVKGLVRCDDPHCASRIYPEIAQFLKVMKLPELDYSVVESLVKNRQILCLSDILLLEQYADMEINTTLSQLLRAVVPYEVCSADNIITMFVNRCNNSMATIEYYLSNPARLVTDLGLNSIFVKRMIDWFSDGYNLTTLSAIVESSQIHITESNKKFDGAPIFRDKTILVTGRFKHGDLDEIISILSSYSASVVTQFSDKVQCVVVGDYKENIDGKAIQSARSFNVPIFDESNFFAEYGIDEDLASNLL